MCIHIFHAPRWPDTRRKPEGEERLFTTPPHIISFFRDLIHADGVGVMVKFFVEPDERYQRSPTREGVGGVVKFFQERTAREPRSLKKKAAPSWLD